MSKDFENKGDDFRYVFNKPIKIVDGSFMLWTADGKNYPIKVYFKVDDNWQLVKQATIQDTNVVHFENENLVTTELRIDTRESNGGVIRYPTDIKILKYYQQNN